MAEVLVTGAGGQVGRAVLSALAKSGHTGRGVDRETLDITDAAALADYFAAHPCDYVVNCAAYTAVDKAETEQIDAYGVNGDGVRNLAVSARQYGFGLVHISTDYVFDGRACRPYVETDATAPLSVYGASKLAGEEALLAVAPARAAIVRTSWVYSHEGANFVQTMLRLGREREHLNVVYDQVGTPTYAPDLAEALVAVMEGLENGGPEIWHFSHEGVTSWYDFAVEIMEQAGLPCQVAPIRTEAYPTPAVRPAYGVLAKEKIKSRLGLSVAHWKDGLRRCLAQMRKEGA
jgi:dTDP-4-dehydrorhamnose reductase